MLRYKKSMQCTVLGCFYCTISNIAVHRSALLGSNGVFNYFELAFDASMVSGFYLSYFLLIVFFSKVAKKWLGRHHVTIAII